MVLLQEWRVICGTRSQTQLAIDHWRLAMSDLTSFKWRHCEANIILCAVRWHLWYALSDRDVEELRRERGVWVDHATVFCCVQRDAAELAQQWRPQLNATNDSYRVDEAYTRIKEHWYYLDRAVDSVGAILDFMLSATRDADAAEQCFRKVLGASHTTLLDVITVGKHTEYPLAFDALQHDGTLPGSCQLKQCRDLNNLVEQDY
jgi:transposase, IS6 family